MIQTPKGVHILAQQIDFSNPATRQTGHFRNDIINGPRDFFSAGVGHDAEGAIFTAPFHDRDKRSGSFHAGFGEAVEFFDFGKANIDHRVVTASPIFDHFWQAVQCLRTENEIHKGSPFADFSPFLTGHTAAHTDNEVRIFLFQLFPAS